MGHPTRPSSRRRSRSPNIALDLLGQARTLLTYAGSFDGRTEDDLAFLRTEREFTHLQIAERPNGDFAATIARQLFFAAYQHALYTRLCGSADADPRRASPARRSRRSPTTATTPLSGRCDSATARRSRTSGCRPG